MRRPVVCLLVITSAALATLWCTGSVKAERDHIPVSIELVLAVDVSLSVDDIEFRLQMGGIADALRRPNIIELIGQHEGGVAVTLLQWSTPATVEQTTHWRLLSDPPSVLAFADEVATTPRAPLGYHTGIGTAIDHSARLIQSNEFRGRERKIDISGDGRNNALPEPEAARTRALARGITINGLAILNNEPDLGDYYSRSVIGGPTAFVITADDYGDFAEAMARKLDRELSILSADRRPPAGAHVLASYPRTPSQSEQGSSD